MILSVAALAAALTGPFGIDSLISRDDYETASIRSGSPRLVKGVVSNGLLTPTQMGVYSTRGRLEIALPKNVAALPKDGLLFRASFRLYAFSDSAEIAWRFVAGDREVCRKVLPRGSASRVRAILPADVEFAVASSGEALCLMTSLSDGTVIRVPGTDRFFAGLGDETFASTLVVSSVDGGTAEVRIDELALAIVKETPPGEAIPPFRLRLSETPDEMKRDWKLVFVDEFDGPADTPPDERKWYFPGWHRHGADYARLDGQGHMRLKCDYEPGCDSTSSTNLGSCSLWSRESWRYGYFEARLKFTRNRGWWSAFWLYGESNYNPLECGAEIDIFEDYYTRYEDRMKGAGPVVALDHNLHINFGGTTKSFNHKSASEGSLDDFHTIGCKWTPFEISLYFDGRLIRSTSKEVAYPTVTFDPFRTHLIATPLHIILSGCVMTDWGPRDTTGCTFPEYFVVDSVRAWKMPEADNPSVSWLRRPAGGFVREGDTLDFEVAAKGPRRIRAAYLFDNGACLGCRTEAPWTFSVPFSRAAYENTRWMKPGRQKKIPEWDGLLHAFDVLVQDEAGNVGAADERVRVIPAPLPKPLAANAQKLPGRVTPSRFDDAGRAVSYWTLRADQKPRVAREGCVSMLHTGEWLSMTVAVERDGTYAGPLEYGPCCSEPSRIDILVDGVRLATATCPSVRDRKWGWRKSEPVSLDLKAGLHVLTFVPSGYLSIRGLELSAVGPKKAVGENFIANGRFETEQSDVPAFWYMDSWNNPENLIVDPTGGPDGLPCVSAKAPAAGEVTSFGMSQKGFRLSEKGRYRLSGWVRKRDFLPRKRSGLVFANSAWTDDSGIDFAAGTCDWTRFEQEVHAVKSENGLLNLCLFVPDYSGSISLADIRLEAMDEETFRQTGKSALVAAQNVPKLIPWKPLLSEVSRECPRVTFRFFGELSDPAAHDAVLTVDGAVCDRLPLPAKGGEVCLSLPQGRSAGRFTVEISNRVSGERVFTRTHDFRTVETCDDAPAGRRLNNMVTELHAGKLPTDGMFRFALRHGGWVYVAVKGADDVLLDGRRVIDSTTPRKETFRELEAGRHVVSVVGGGTAELTVRRIPELFSFAPVNGPIRESPSYDWAFQERYVLPAVTTLNGGEIPQDVRARYRASGRLWLGNMISKDLKDGQDLRRRLEKSCGMSAAAIFYDGVTCDEQGFTDVPTMARYAEGLWSYGDPQGKRAYTWIIGSPATDGVDHDLLSSAANGTGGRGRFLSEIYLVARPTEEKARAALNLAARDKVGVFRRYSPLVDQKYGVIFGAFNQAPGISLCVYPEVDYRYYLDMQFHLLANDPAFKDLSCTGVWGSYRADDELHRWTFMLMRHYFVEGRADMLSPSYGFRYLPGHLRNPDFADGFSCWKTTGDVRIESTPGFGLKTEGRWQSPRGVGDTYAVLSRKDETETAVVQTVGGLQPGKKYVLRFAAFDAEDVRTARFAPRRVGVEVELRGAEIDKTLSWEHVDDRPVKEMKGARINFRQIVFTAKAAEAAVRFHVAEAASGQRLGLNYISLLPYLPR